MRIGIDCRTILNPEAGEKAGIGHYTYHLVTQLIKQDRKNRYVLFFDHTAGSTKAFQRKHTTVVQLPLSQHKQYLPLVYSHGLVSRYLNKQKLDVFHGPANSIPLTYMRPAVVTVHDLAIYEHPEWFPQRQGFSTKVAVPQSVKKAQQVIAVSQSTADAVIRKFAAPSNKVNVIHEGVVPYESAKPLMVRRVRKQFYLGERYLLYIGTLEPRKNVVRLIKAFEELVAKHPKRYQDIQLVLAGAKGYQFNDVYTEIHNAKSGKVRYIGYVSDAEKQALLTGALAFVFPSLYEGFGLPLLEAMQLGVPVIAGQAGAIPEVVENAAQLVPPTSIQGIAKGINDVVARKATRERLVKAGTQRVKEFSWERCATETLEIYERAVTV